MKRASAALLLLAVLVAGAAAQQQQCLLTSADVSKIDFSGVKSACKSSSNGFCENCTCALVSAFVPTLMAKGMNDAKGLTADQAQAQLTACLGVVYGPMARAGVDVMGLLALQNCKEAPACLSQYL